MTEQLLSILMVDDDPNTRIILRKLLERQGHFVQSAGGCKEAIFHAQRIGFHLLIADAALPDGDGLTLLQEIQQLYPIEGIAISGSTDLAERARQGKFAAYLEKPISFPRLLEELKRLFPGKRF